MTIHMKINREWSWNLLLLTSDAFAIIKGNGRCISPPPSHFPFLPLSASFLSSSLSLPSPFPCSWISLPFFPLSSSPLPQYYLTAASLVIKDTGCLRSNQISVWMLLWAKLINDDTSEKWFKNLWRELLYVICVCSLSRLILYCFIQH